MTWRNTDTGLGHNVFFKENINLQIAIGDGGGHLKGFLEYSEMASEGAATDNIQELNGLTSRRTIERKFGPIGWRILKLVIYWDRQNSRNPN